VNLAWNTTGAVVLKEVVSEKRQYLRFSSCFFHPAPSCVMNSGDNSW
jgi:hypothetical protein